MSLGEIPEECIEGIMAESIADPTLKQVSALARKFGVEPSYLVDETAEALTGGKIALALSDDTIREIMRGCARLPSREKDLILGIVRQFEDMGADDDADSPMPTCQRLTRTDSTPRSVCPSLPTTCGPDYRDPPSRRTARRSELRPRSRTPLPPSVCPSRFRPRTKP
jgi:hypothetical protein